MDSGCCTVFIRGTVSRPLRVLWDLDFWLAEKHIVLSEVVDTPEDRFEPEDAQEGALRPIEGGMAPGITGRLEREGANFMSISGMDDVEQALKDIPGWEVEQSIFFEMSACSGSCINGPKAARNTSIARRRYDVIQYAQSAGEFPVSLRSTLLNITIHHLSCETAIATCNCKRRCAL